MSENSFRDWKRFVRLIYLLENGRSIKDNFYILYFYQRETLERQKKKEIVVNSLYNWKGLQAEERFERLQEEMSEDKIVYLFNII